MAKQNEIIKRFSSVTDHTVINCVNGFFVKVEGRDREGRRTSARFVCKTVKALQTALQKLDRLKEEGSIGERFRKVIRYTVKNYANGFFVEVEGYDGYDRDAPWDYDANSYSMNPMRRAAFVCETPEALQTALQEVTKLVKSGYAAEIDDAPAQNIGEYFRKVDDYTVTKVYNGFLVKVNDDRFVFKTLKELQAAVEELARLKETAKGTIGERFSKVFHYKFQADNNGFVVLVEGYDREGDRTSVEFFFKTLKELLDAVEDLAEKMVDD
jgi:hypothetical protein